MLSEALTFVGGPEFDTGPPKVKRRPLIIDENDGPCEICAARRNGVCDECGLDGRKCIEACEAKCASGDRREHQSIGLMRGVHSDNTKHVGASGFESPRPSHYHLTPILGVNGRRAHWGELCYDCYRSAYITEYGKDPFVS